MMPSISISRLVFACKLPSPKALLLLLVLIGGSYLIIYQLNGVTGVTANLFVSSLETGVNMRKISHKVEICHS